MAFGSATEQLLVVLRANTTDFTRKMAAAEKQSTSFSKNSTEGLKRVSSVGGSSLLATAGKVALVGGAVAAATKVAFGFAERFATATAAVRGFQRATGDTAENASKLLFALNRVGIDASTAEKAFFRFSREISTGKANISAYGAEVARNQDGSVNMARTVTSLAGAFRKMTAGARGAAAVQLFGKQGQALLPILGKTRAEITALFKEAGQKHQIFSQEDLDKGRLFSIQMKELTSTFQGFALEIGKAVAPALTEAAGAFDSFLQTLEKGKDLLGPGKAGGLSSSDFGRAISQGFTDAQEHAQGFVDSLTSGDFKGALDELGKGFTFKGAIETADLAASGLKKYETAVKDASTATAALAGLSAEGKRGSKEWKEQVALLNRAQKEQSSVEDEVARASGKVSQSQRDAAQAAAELRQKTQDLQTSLLGLGDAQRGVAESQLNIADAQAHAADAAKALAEARASGDPTRIAQAERDLFRATLDVQGATESAAQAVLRATGITDTFNAAAADPRTRAEILARLTAAQTAYPQLAPLLQPYIDKLNAIPPTKNTHVTATDAASPVLDGILARMHEFERGATAVLRGVVAPGPRRNPLDGGIDGDPTTPFATGGRIRKGTKAIVGERGPEVFVPHQTIAAHSIDRVKGMAPFVIGGQGPQLFIPPVTGRVIPNHQLSDFAIANAQKTPAGRGLEKFARLSDTDEKDRKLTERVASRVSALIRTTNKDESRQVLASADNISQKLDGTPADDTTLRKATDRIQAYVDRLRERFTPRERQDKAKPNLRHLAQGGLVLRHEPVVVGERGPELFVPNSAAVRHASSVPSPAPVAVGAGGVRNYQIDVRVAPGADVASFGKEVVKAISAYERRNGKSWRN